MTPTPDIAAQRIVECGRRLGTRLRAGTTGATGSGRVA